MTAFSSIVSAKKNTLPSRSMVHDNDTDEIGDLSNREILKILLDEIVLVRGELKEDIANLDAKLTMRIDGVESRLGNRINGLGSQLHLLNLKVDRNHLTFMNHIESYDKRLLSLESK